ncbi:MAG: glycosyltransferase [Anaerolineae bacterium]|nr:glycosyltransferase [Anaerolineae bacterium]
MPFTFPRLRAAPSGPAVAELPGLVSVLIPARNEAAVIAETVRALLENAPPGFPLEVLLLDDGSEDGTGALALAAAGDDPRFRLLSGQPLPPGWLGKNWACHQLSEVARGEVLIFTDADVRWGVGALPAVLGKMRGYDMLSVWSTQKTVTWGERLVVPLMALAISGYLPEVMVRFSGWFIFAAANGQVIAFRRAAYAALGGHAAVRNKVVEDVTLARNLKKLGRRLIMLDGAGVITCRMYRSWPEVRDGFAKNILAGHGDSLALLAFSTVFHWAVFVLPWVWLLLGWALPLGPGYPAVPLLMVGAGTGVRALSAAITRQRPQDALLMPLSVLLMTRIAWRSARWKRGGRGQWKGRTLA